MIEAAAPGWPSAAFIMAALERRLSTISTASRVTMMPIGSQIQPQSRMISDNGERQGDQNRGDDQRHEPLVLLRGEREHHADLLQPLAERDLLLGLCHARQCSGRPRHRPAGGPGRDQETVRASSACW